jgi:hypothetical protein
MIPEDKAEELFEKMYFETTTKHDAKQCALIAVDELIKETSFEVPNICERYWQEVKQEINNL